MGAAKIDRTISYMRNFESSVTVLCKSSFRLNTSTTTALSADWSYPQIAATDEFISLSQQFNTFKVKSMKFEIFHTNPTATGATAISTVHADVAAALPSTWTTEASVTDAPDALYLQPGSGKETLYWNANGTGELQYQDVNNFHNKGGFRAYSDQTTSVQLIGIVIATAVVTFRGRH